MVTDASLPGRYCKKCLYDLRATQPRDGGQHQCPECGRAFDPKDRLSFWRDPLTFQQRFWLGPPRLLAIVTVLAGLLVLWLGRLPGNGLGLTAVGLLLGGVLWLLWVVRSSSRRYWARRAPDDAHLLRRLGRWWWRAMPLTSGAVVLALLLRLPLWITLLISQPAMAAAASGWSAQAAATTPTEVHTSRGWFGLVHASRVMAFDGRVYFVTGGFYDSVGFCHDPAGPPPEYVPTDAWGDLTHRHTWGAWSIFHSSSF